MEDIKLINGDCLQGIQKLHDKSVDLILTDIPYDSVNRESNGLRKSDKGKADVITFDLDEMLDECIRVCKGSIYIFCGTKQVSPIDNKLRRGAKHTNDCVGKDKPKSYEWRFYLVEWN